MIDGASSQLPEVAQNKWSRSSQVPDQKSPLPTLPAWALIPKASVSPGAGPAEANVGRRKRGLSTSDVNRPTMSLLLRFGALLRPGQMQPSGGSQPASDTLLPAQPTRLQTDSDYLLT